MKNFDQNKDGPLHEQIWVKKEIENFDRKIYGLKQQFCHNCHEMWPSTESICKQCRSNPLKFSERNNMLPQIENLPDNIKADFEQLTMVEEMLISPILAVMSIYRLPGGALINRGFCANFSQDIGELLQTLPRLPKDLPLLILKKKDQNNNVKQFNVKRERVHNVLKYLCQNNTAYIANNIKIDQNNLEQLPLDDIPQDLNTIDDTNCENVDKYIIETGPTIEERNSNVVHEEYQAFIESDSNEPLQIDNIRSTINFPRANKKALNEFTMDSICALLFPKLFPNGHGDPTTKSKINLFKYRKILEKSF